MTFYGYGVVGSVDDTQWALYEQDSGDARAGMAVISGLSVSVTAATRGLSVSAGRSVQAGTRFVSDAAYTLALGAPSGSTRIDTVCAQIDWVAARAAFAAAGGTSNLAAASAAAISAAASIFVVPGTPGSSSPATLTQTPGTKWQTPLATVPVQPGDTGAFPSSRVTSVRPLVSHKVYGGHVVVTPTAADTKKSVSVTFPGVFATVPEVGVFLASDVSGYNLQSWATNVTTTGFTANLLRGSATATTLTWHAVSAS